MSKFDIFSNPYTGDAAKGRQDAIDALVNALFGGSGDIGDSDPNSPLKMPVSPKSKNSKQSDSEQRASKQKSSSSQSSSSSSSSKDQNSDPEDQNPDSKDDKSSSSGWSLSEEEMEKLAQKLGEIRDASQDVISDEERQDVEDDIEDLDAEIDKDLEKESDPEDRETLKKIKGRLKSIADFFDDPKNQKAAKLDIDVRNKIAGAKEKAMKSQRSSYGEYIPEKPLPKVSIKQIASKISQTLKNAYGGTQRKSSWSYYNPRARAHGYYAPGRYTEKTKEIPSIGFFFDMSGSWRGNAEKIEMGNCIENELIKLHNQKIINLTRYYFADKTSTSPNKVGYGNSDAPLPYIANLISNKDLDNMIIMTDSDPGGNPPTVQVPGYCWLLFYDDVSAMVYNKASGKRGTSRYMIDHN